MSALYWLIPVSILFLVIAIGLFIWAVNNEQFQDLERHGSDILFDEDDKPNDP